MSSIKTIFTDIANAIRTKLGNSTQLKPTQMADAINNITTGITPNGTKNLSINTNGTTTENVNDYEFVKVTTNVVPNLQSKSFTPTKSTTAITADSGYDGLSTVTVNAIPSQYIIPSGSQTATVNKTYDVTSLAELIVNVAGGGGALPSGISAFDFGDVNITTAFTTSAQTFNHNLGVVPDLMMVYAPNNVATTYSMLAAIRGNVFGWRSSAYNSHYVYHGNSTTTVTWSNSNGASTGISNMTSTTFRLSSPSSSYSWRVGTYNYIAIKFQ